MNHIDKITHTIMGIVLGIVLFALLLFSGTAVSNAATQEDAAYELALYDYEAVVHKDHTYTITEKLTVNNPEDLKQLSFTVPTGNYRLSKINVKGVDYDTKTEGKNIVVTIKSKDMLKKGKHSFTVNYKISEYTDKTKDADIFYLKALSPNWDIPISKIKISIVLPNGFPWDDLQYYAGQFGTEDVNNKLKVKSDANTIMMTGDRIPENYAITFKAELPQGYWQGAIDNNWASPFAAFVMLGALAITFLLWLIGGRDPRFKTKKTVYPVEGLTPVEVGYLFSARIRTKDVVTLLIYLASKGYFTISEYAPKKYRLYKKEEPKGEEKYIRNVYNTLFDDVYEGRPLEMDDLISKIPSIKESIKTNVSSGYSSKDMRASTTLSKVFRIISVAILSLCMGFIPLLAQLFQYKELTYGISIAVVCISAIVLLISGRYIDYRYDIDKSRFRVIFGGNIILFLAMLIYVATIMWLASGSLIISTLIVVFGALSALFVLFMNARAKGNAKIVSELNSLRHFINTATEKELIILTAHDNDYYYKMIPYAFLFSLMDGWAKKFRWMQIPAPEWFSDDIEGHAITKAMRPGNTMDYSREINAFARTIISETVGEVSYRKGKKEKN